MQTELHKNYDRTIDEHSTMYFLFIMVQPIFPEALSQSIPDFRTWVQHTHKFWCYRIATVTIIYVLHGNKSLILTLILTLTLNPIYC